MRAQTALNRLYISFCIRNSRDHVCKTNQNNTFTTLTNPLLSTLEERQDPTHGLGREPQGPVATPNGAAATYRITRSGILTESCDMNETNVKYANEYLRFSHISNKIDLFIKLKRQKSVQNSFSNPPRAARSHNCLSKFSPMALSCSPSPSPRPHTFLKRGGAGLIPKTVYKGCQNPLRVSDEDPELFFNHN